MLLNIVEVIGGLALLIWGADRFVHGAAATARNMGIAPLLIGLTIVAFATSAPEMLVSAMAAVNGSPTLGIGNALGSNIANIGLVLGTLVAGVAWRSPSFLRRADHGQRITADGIGIWRTDPVFGYAHVPSTEGHHVLPESFDVVYTIDGSGNRVTPRTTAPLARILVLGGSFSFGHGVEDDEAVTVAADQVHVAVAVDVERQDRPGALGQVVLGQRSEPRSLCDRGGTEEEQRERR